MTETTTEAAECWPIRPEKTGEIFYAVRVVGALMGKHDLPPICKMDVESSNSGKRWNPATREFDLPVIPKVTLYMPGSRAFAAWARAVGVTNVFVKRRSGVDTCMNAWADHNGVTFSLWGSYGFVLGASDDVEWDRDRRGRRTNDGRMTVDALAALPEVDYVRPATPTA